MGSANMLDRLQQFRADVGRVMPFRQAPDSEEETDAIDDELTEEEEEHFAQMVSFLGRLFPFVRPSPEFRARLKEALLAEHRRRLGNEGMLPARQEGGISWRWSLAATVPLLIGVLATILWRRSHRSNEQLISPVVGR
ncbi:MAG: hypothetical protein OXI80_02865 [Caldilineaceae bacterium]|nr:hypothetical protein [Caldilineaceae bacterium]MDE0336588.1 hypothetical protein [Caldilineaceae bacterium]